nr:cation diffusion facilitator family transporter [Novosphingobium sp. G106]
MKASANGEARGAHDHGSDDHEHASHAHNHAAGANAKMLTISLALTATYLVAEIVGAFAFNSLALLSDAGHMLTDVAALLIALMAIRIGQRAPDDKRTFGYRRFEILAAAFNALMLFAVAIYVLIEAVQRFRTPEPVQSTGMLVVAVIGLVVNLVSMRSSCPARTRASTSGALTLRCGRTCSVRSGSSRAPWLSGLPVGRSWTRSSLSVSASGSPPAHVDIAARYDQRIARRRARGIAVSRNPQGYRQCARGNWSS